MADPKKLFHEFGPLYDHESRVLILGSFPSVKSREQQFFYGHPQNRFWRIIRSLHDPELMEQAKQGLPIPNDLTVPQKKDLILHMHLALWDTIESCVITGSSDSSIRDVQVNDITVILKNAPIRAICCNGTASYNLFVKHALPDIRKYYRNAPGQTEKIPDIVKLPSTSPANAAWSLPRLLDAWTEILKY